MPLFGGDKAKEFFEAVRDKEFSRAERLLNDKNAGVGYKDKESGRTALHYAVIRKYQRATRDAADPFIFSGFQIDGPHNAVLVPTNKNRQQT